MSEPTGEVQWFQWVIGVLVAGLTMAFGWMQIQIGQVKRDAQSADESVRREMLNALAALDEKLTQRYADSSAMHERMHKDNQDRIRELRDDMARGTQTATEERRRVIDYLDKINTRIGQMPDRAEMMAVLRDTKGGD
jgi:CRP-like cAMP-binding protein